MEFRMASHDAIVHSMHRHALGSVSHHGEAVLSDSGRSSGDNDVTGHPSVEEIAAYLGGQLSPASRTAFEAHLSGCRECRDEVVSAKLLMTEKRSWRHVWIVPGVAAALLLIGFLMRPSALVDRQRAPKEETTAAGSIPVLSPPAETGDRALSFAWRSSGSGARYTFVLSDSAGNLVWEAQTPDTSIALPDSVSLSHGTRYNWYVDASAPNGMTSTSGVQSFRVKR
jgi:hypothetical protein